MHRLHDATQAAVGAAAGIGYIELGGSYWVLAGAGALIGLVHWFHDFSHADPQWSRGRASSEAMKSMLFGLVVMPAAIDVAKPILIEHGVCTPATEIAVGTLAAFAAVELAGIGMKWLKKFAGVSE